MGIEHNLPKSPHWSYFLVLEQDLEQAARYVEFADANYQTYSLEFAHLLFAASAEIEVVLKQLCELFEPGSKPQNMGDYKELLRKPEHLPYLADLRVAMPRFGLTLNPWDNWAEDEKGQVWWKSYNEVKHSRHTNFSKATLKNALNAMAALYLVNLKLMSLARKEDGIALLDGIHTLSINISPGSRLFAYVA